MPTQDISVIHSAFTLEITALTSSYKQIHRMTSLVICIDGLSRLGRILHFLQLMAKLLQTSMTVQQPLFC